MDRARLGAASAVRIYEELVRAAGATAIDVLESLANQSIPAQRSCCLARARAYDLRYLDQRRYEHAACRWT